MGWASLETCFGKGPNWGQFLGRGDTRWWWVEILLKGKRE